MNEYSNSSNAHRRYVNAERGDEGIPEYFKDQLNSKLQNDLVQEAVFRELWYSNDVVHSLRSLESNFDESRQTVQARLDEMVEQGVLNKGSINNGDYWWINFPESNQPLPKDVVVYPKVEDQETTVSEFFNQLPVVIGIAALFTTAIGGALFLVGGFQSTGALSVPIPNQEIYRVGFLSFFAAYLFLLLAVIVWIVEKAFVPKGEDIVSIFKEN